MRRCLAICLLAGCGRVSFDGLPADARADATADVVQQASTCATTSALVCDPFEGPSVDPRWIDVYNGERFSIDSARSYRGGSSLHVAVPATEGGPDPGALLATYQGMPVTGPLVLRVWAYFQSPYPAASGADQFVDFADDVGFGASIVEENGTLANNDYANARYNLSTTRLPLDRWVCLRLELPSGMDGTTRLTVDDVALASVDSASSNTTVRPTHLYLGPSWPSGTGAQGQADVWFDELIIDTQPTDCAR